MSQSVALPKFFIGKLFALLSFVWLAACEPVAIDTNANTGQRIDTSIPVQVALLVPGGGTDGSDQLIANDLESAARLAIGDLNGVDVDLRVYNTGSNPTQAATVARAAVDDGAKILKAYVKFLST